MVLFQRSKSLYPHKLRRLYWPFLALAEACRDVIGIVAGSFTADGNRYTIPRFTFLGPEEGTQTRLGLFAILNGDEPSGASALLRLMETLAAEPGLARGYDVVCYPICNPTGYEEGTRHNRAGVDLSCEFWRGSLQPEVQILEAELNKERFDGIIVLRASDTDDQTPSALRPFETALPRNTRSVSGSFAAGGGWRSGRLSAPAGQWPRPLQLVFRMPSWASMAQQAQCGCDGLLSVLAGFRGSVATKDGS
jgi:protein MpaA